jgi:hypothetical protein
MWSQRLSERAFLRTFRFADRLDWQAADEHRINAYRHLSKVSHKLMEAGFKRGVVFYVFAAFKGKGSGF